MIRVVNIFDEPHTLYIGHRRYGTYKGQLLNNRDHGFWGMPFKIGRDGGRLEVLAMYRDWLIHSEFAHEHRRRLPDLRGEVLGCHCKRPGINIPCHGDILAELAEWTVLTKLVPP